MAFLNKSSFEWQESFREIQSFQDNEVNEVLQRLLKDDEFVPAISHFLQLSHKNAPQCDAIVATELNALGEMHSIEQIQAWIEKNIFPVVADSYQSVVISGLDSLDTSGSYIFISNHRDIIMDPLLLNKALRAHNFSTANCAIGDNLLLNPVAHDLALLNRCFKIFRSLKSPRAILQAMKNQSAYIQYLHFNKQEHIWIAQKEGRAKDNHDKTNPALIKMLGLARPKETSLESYLEQLNIVPVCFSYEWDPCDTDKAVELVTQEHDIDYKKNKFDDFIAVKKGMAGYKGKINIHFGKRIKANEQGELNHIVVARELDKFINEHYINNPVNYAAYKKIYRKLPDNCPFDKQEINEANKLLEKRIENESEEIKRRVYAAYAQTLVHTAD